MTLRMTILAGSMKDQAFLLQAESIKIGRGPGVDFELKEGSISKVHALISVSGDHIRVEDLDSTHGLIVGGKKVKKIRLRKGVIQLGKIPIRLEFDSDVAPAQEVPVHETIPPEEVAAQGSQLPAEADIPKVDEVHWDDDSDGDESLGLPSLKDDENKVSKLTQTLSYAFLILCLLGIVVFAMKDSFTQEPEKLEFLKKFIYNIHSADPYPHTIELPYPYAGPRGDNIPPEFDKESFHGQINKGTKTLFLITPKKEIEGVEIIYIPLEGNRKAKYTIKINSDDTKLLEVKVVFLDQKSVTALFKAVRKTYLAHDQSVKNIHFDDRIMLWKKLKMIVDSSQLEDIEGQVIYRELQAVEQLKKEFDSSFEDERLIRYRSAKTELRKYRQTGNLLYLQNSINQMENMMTFTDKTRDLAEYKSYKQFLYHLKSYMKFNQKRAAKKR